MGIKEAYKIFGLAQGAGLNEVKKRAGEITETMLSNSIKYIKNAYIGILPLDVFYILYFTFTFLPFHVSSYQ